MRKYGAPLFCAAWARAGDGDDSEESYVVCGGGGGAANTGIKNLLVAAKYEEEELSEPIHTHLSEDPAVSIAMHPGCREFLCVFSSQKARRVELFRVTGSGKAVQLEALNRELKPLQAVGTQRATITFSYDAKLLACGEEDGRLLVIKWPSLEAVLEADTQASIRDLDFSPDGAFLAVTNAAGPSRVWDLHESSLTGALAVNRAAFCRFSRNATRPCIFVTSAEDAKGYVTVWNMQWQKIASKKLQDQPISAFSISNDGELLAIGSPDGPVSIVTSRKLSVVKRVRHMVLVTAVSFSPDGRYLLSASADSSAMVTPCKATRKGWHFTVLLWMLLFVVALVLSVTSTSRRRSSPENHDLI